MGVGLQPLEFTECLADSPQFRDNLQRHEKELERTSQQIKRLIKEVKDVVSAARRLGAAQLALATSMEQLEFTCIGASMTEDERVISHSLHHFAHLIRTIEDERDRMLGRADDQIIKPLEKFRKEHIGAVKEGKKKFDKKTAKFCQSQERTLSLSTKKPETVFQEADAAMDMAERDFCQASLEYVRQLQGVHERKKFELVETLLGFVFSWWTFHHTAHDVHSDAEPRVRDLQLRIQRTRSNYEEMSKQTESLMKKMMELRQTSKEPEGADEVMGGVSRSGYLFLMEKKAFGTAWSKQYVTYDKSSKILTLTPFNQINVKTSLPSESVCVCGARGCSEPPERRFCWECVAAAGPGAGPAGAGPAPVLTLQALSEPDRAAWLRALDSDPLAARCTDTAAAQTCGVESGGETCQLDEAGFTFVKTLIAVLEARGLEEQGLYRVAGVASKVSRLLAAAPEPRRLPALGAGGGADWESKTLTSALKAYLRALPQPLLTTRLHRQFIAAAKLERSERLAAVQALVQALPLQHYDMLRIVVTHLANVAAKSDKNLMTTSNLAVCFGPTLLRAERETVASILEIKFYNVIVETLLEHAADVFTLERDASPPQRNGITRYERCAGRGIVKTLIVKVLSPRQLPARTSPASVPVTARNDIKCWSERGGVVSRYSPHHQHLLQQFLPPPAAGAGLPPAAAPPPAVLHTVAPPPPPHVAPQALLALRGVARSSSSSAESVSSASPPPPHAALHTRNYRYTRVRTLYACLGESEGELSFEPNQIITNVSPSAEPGWLRGSLNGKQGLVPENYVEPLP